MYMLYSRKIVHIKSVQLKEFSASSSSSQVRVQNINSTSDTFPCVLCSSIPPTPKIAPVVSFNTLNHLAHFVT